MTTKRKSMLRARGVDGDRARELLAQMTARDAAGDDRHLCLECRHLQPGNLADGPRCELASAGRLRGAARDLAPVATVMQRCPGFRQP